MAFTLETFNQTSSGKNTESVTVFSYSTPDTLSTGNAGYFDEVKGALKVGDIIDMVFDTDSAPNTQHTKLRVTNLDPVEVLFMSDSFFNDTYHIGFRLERDFFTTISNFAPFTPPIEEIGYSRVRIASLTIQYQYDAGATLPYLLTLNGPSTFLNLNISPLAPGTRFNVGLPDNGQWVMDSSDSVGFTSNNAVTIPEMSVFDVLFNLEPVA